MRPPRWPCCPPRPAGEQDLSISLDQEEAGRERAALEAGLPAGPDAGFFGRDETLLALDRAFDAHRVVLLHAWAGAGKTSTALEFARWYALTGAVGGVLFTSLRASPAAGPAAGSGRGPVRAGAGSSRGALGGAG